jgi:hypothetical protein
MSFRTMNRTMTRSADTSGGETTSAAASSGPDPAWLLEELPKCSVRYGRHASATPGSTGVVAL